MAQVLQIKIGLPTRVTFADGSTLETAIRKQPVAQAELNELGLVGNDVGLKAHHGGVDKAVFIMGAATFAKLNALTGKNFGYDGTAVYGENLVWSELDEYNVRVGDVYQIGDCLLEIAQPRRPCSRLSKNTDYQSMQKVIFESGLTGWYARVLQAGTIRLNDEVKLLTQGEECLTIMALNQQIAARNPDNPDLIRFALDYPPLANAFKRSLNGKLRGEDGMVKG